MSVDRAAFQLYFDATAHLLHGAAALAGLARDTADYPAGQVEVFAERLAVYRRVSRDVSAGDGGPAHVLARLAPAGHDPAHFRVAQAALTLLEYLRPAAPDQTFAPDQYLPNSPAGLRRWADKAHADLRPIWPRARLAVPMAFPLDADATAREMSREMAVAADFASWPPDRQALVLAAVCAPGRDATPAAALTPTGPRKGVPKAEAEVKVREWLTRHAAADPDAVTRDAVAAGTRVSAGAVSKTAAWKAFVERRRSGASPSGRTVPLTDRMLATIPADGDNLAVLDDVIEDQRRDAAADARRRKRRHGPS